MVAIKSTLIGYVFMELEHGIVKRVQSASENPTPTLPADKVANNVIVVCRKKYNIVLREVSTYECDERDCEHMSEHLQN